MTPYNDSDRIINSKISDLYTYVVEKMKEFQYEDSRIKDITTYGIFPYYTEQKLKVLFIGREARGLSGQNYMDVMFKAYKEFRIGQVHLNGSSFHRRLLQVAFYLNNPTTDIFKMPSAIDIAKDFGSPGGCSFAFMHLSKFSNESDSSNTNSDLLNEFNLDFEFTKRFIEIVAPDLIISMGLERPLKIAFQFRANKKLRTAHFYRSKVGAKEIEWIDGYHYSAANKQDIDSYLNPITHYLIRKNIKK